MLEENLLMMVLAEHQKISQHTINNFRSSDHANELIKKSFLYFTNLLEQEGLINEGAIFIDGTKIEADANRYTFVWRKAVEKYHEKLKAQAVEVYDEQDDYYLDQNGVRFSFKYYSRSKDKATGHVRDFKVYEADEFQLTPELERLAKTKSGPQRQVRYNPNWQYLKEKDGQATQIKSQIDRLFVSESQFFPRH